MLASHEQFYSVNGKRRILVADDEMINREILAQILGGEYEVIKAVDGVDAYEKAEEYKTTLSLIMLDIIMPRMTGIEFLKKIKADPGMKDIPVIVLTSDDNSEVESLELGAADFIPKPYPRPGVILARVRRSIELSEDRQIITATERDALTGLYTSEYFFRYVKQFDQFHPEREMDALVIDVNHFHMINERFGAAYGDEVLRRIADRLRDAVRSSDGFVCRHGEDIFYVYCPHNDDYRDMLRTASIGLSGEDYPENRVRLRMGVYEKVDKELEVERRFDRAKMACDKLRNSYTANIGVYDETLHEKELYAEQLIEEFGKALEEEQFAVFYQPKFNVVGDKPYISSAEALVRWFHPTLGMISPGAFIPLFESNGLIQKLDEYVWRKTAAKIAEWKERLGFSVPVSVNVSRADMYDPGLINTFNEIISSNGLTPADLNLEVTESAYTKDTEQIIHTLNELRGLGYFTEMDDFGTGYSSLNMISELPIDALKLDRQFTVNAFDKQKDTRMIEIIIDIANYLSVPVIAEGVETEEQYSALRELGCDIIQGYYFSRPVPPEEFEKYLIERKHQLEEAGE
ncbi:MAG: EAL domain-containing protein [Clostridia bacterium]|nr:EAL domain-containing protein [Clostridia bacterium]